jgi:hypothetical protein
VKHKFIFTRNGRKTKQIKQIPIRICFLGKGLLTEPCSVLLLILPSIFYALSQNKIVMMLSIMHYDDETGYFRGYSENMDHKLYCNVSQTVTLVPSWIIKQFSGHNFLIKTC